MGCSTLGRFPNPFQIFKKILSLLFFLGGGDWGRPMFAPHPVTPGSALGKLLMELGSPYGCQQSNLGQPHTGKCVASALCPILLLQPSNHFFKVASHPSFCSSLSFLYLTLSIFHCSLNFLLYRSTINTHLYFFRLLEKIMTVITTGRISHFS